MTSTATLPHETRTNACLSFLRNTGYTLVLQAGTRTTDTCLKTRCSTINNRIAIQNSPTRRSSLDDVLYPTKYQKLKCIVVIVIFLDKATRQVSSLPPAKPRYTMFLSSNTRRGPQIPASKHVINRSTVSPGKIPPHNDPRLNEG